MTLKKHSMAKSLTWEDCLNYTLRNLETWRDGGGRDSAILYSGYFTKMQGRTFPVHRITKGLMTELCTTLKIDGKKNGTINRFISAVSMVLKYCKKNDIIKFDLPTPFQRLKERDKTIRKYYTKDQVKEMLRISKDVMYRDDLHDIIQAAALTGMRMDELLKLPAWRVDFNLGVINCEYTKSDEARCIPIHPQLMPTLIKRCQDKPEKGYPGVKVFGVDWTNSDQVRYQFKQLLHRHMNFIEDGSYVFHCLRHSFATWHLAQGTPPIDLMSMLGHANLETTLEYAKATEEGKKKSMNRMEF